METWDDDERGKHNHIFRYSILSISAKVSPILGRD